MDLEALLFNNKTKQNKNKALSYGADDWKNIVLSSMNGPQFFFVIICLLLVKSVSKSF